jgi:hypothetical protein
MVFDSFLWGKLSGREYVPREGQSEYMQPDYYGRDRRDGPPGDPASRRAARTLAVKLVVMAMVILGLLVAVMVIFT